MLKDFFKIFRDLDRTKCLERSSYLNCYQTEALERFLDKYPIFFSFEGDDEVSFIHGKERETFKLEVEKIGKVNETLPQAVYGITKENAIISVREVFGFGTGLANSLVAKDQMLGLIKFAEDKMRVDSGKFPNR